MVNGTAASRTMTLNVSLSPEGKVSTRRISLALFTPKSSAVKNATFKYVAHVAMPTKNCFNFNSLDSSSLLLQLRPIRDLYYSFLEL